jgi:PhzF family phenazine biosynthesis protein
VRPRLLVVDAFTDKPFAGNPAAVCVLDRAPDEGWMQSLAAELNLSETAFLTPGAAALGTDVWRLRWFTPTVEVELCGHATLASAHALWKSGTVDAQVLRFVTLSGELTATRTPDGWIELDFPADPPHPTEPPEHLLAGLGLDDGVVGVHQGRTDVVVELASTDLVRGIVPDFLTLREVAGIRAVIVTAVGEGLYDIVSRVFAPASGIDEDPVTGSAHCTLGPFWAERLVKDDLLAYQASARGGVVRVGVRDDRVLLGGQAVTVSIVRLDDAALPRRAKVPRRASAR